MRFSMLIALSLATALVGCGDDETDDASGPVKLSEFLGEVAAAECDYMVRCTILPDKSSCSAGAAIDYELIQLTVDAQNNENGVTYNEPAGRPYVDAVRGRSCNNTIAARKEVESAFAPVFKVTRKLGDACLIDEHCAGSGRACDRSMCNEQCCGGVCIEAPPNAAIGASCENAECGDDAFCDEDESGSPICMLRLSNGESCPRFNSCKDGLQCDANGARACYKLSPDGGTCNPDLDFPCLNYNQGCNPETRKCELLPPAGQPCAGNGNGCQAYATCTNGTCEAIGSVGASCENNNECMGDIECRDNACTTPTAKVACIGLEYPMSEGNQ